MPGPLKTKGVAVLAVPGAFLALCAFWLSREGRRKDSLWNLTPATTLATQPAMASKPLAEMPASVVASEMPDRSNLKVESALLRTRAQFEELERRRAKLLQEIHTSTGDTTLVITFETPPLEDINSYTDLLTSMMSFFSGSEEETSLLRKKADALMVEFTEYPMPLKVIHLGVTSDRRNASFTERFAPDAAGARINVAASTYTSASGDRLRDDDCNAKDSWARRRYGYLFSSERRAARE